MANTFRYAGRESSSFFTFVSDSNGWNSAPRILNDIQVPGRSGTLTPLNSNTFNNFQLIYQCYMTKEMKLKLDELRAYLNAFSGYQRLEDTINPTYYRMARYNGSFEVGDKDKQGATFSIKFDCMPQKFLKSGEATITLTTSGTIKNPTSYDAKPILKIYGTGEVKIGTSTIKVKKAGTQYIEFDCDTLNAYDGSDNRNSNIELVKEPLLIANIATGITLGPGITKVEIKPRWYTI
nr:MAG TPA: distal tail protein [Caudoviricetes sp.]